MLLSEIRLDYLTQLLLVKLILGEHIQQVELFPIDQVAPGRLLLHDHAQVVSQDVGDLISRETVRGLGDDRSQDVADVSEVAGHIVEESVVLVQSCLGIDICVVLHCEEQVESLALGEGQGKSVLVDHTCFHSVPPSR